MRQEWRRCLGALVAHRLESLANEWRISAPHALGECAGEAKCWVGARLDLIGLAQARPGLKTGLGQIGLGRSECDWIGLHCTWIEPGLHQDWTGARTMDSGLRMEWAGGGRTGLDGPLALHFEPRPGPDWRLERGLRWDGKEWNGSEWLGLGRAVPKLCMEWTVWDLDWIGDWTGLETGLGWTGLGWTTLDWTGPGLE